MIKTDICDLLQIEYPIFQGGMAWLGTAELAAAVSEAGGLGIIGAGHMPPDIFRNEIHKLKERTSKPFGCNIMLMSPFVKEVMEVVVEERVPVITTGAGNPGVYVPALKEIGTKVIPVVASVLLAKRLLAVYIAMSIADRPGLVAGFVGGLLANQGGSGFLGALIAGFAAGYLVLLVKKLVSGLPQALEGTKPVLFYPVLGVLFIGIAITFIINPPVSALNHWLMDSLQSMGTTSRVLLGLIFGAMMSVDMGGPVNKAAYVIGTGALATGEYGIMAAVMAGGMVPPLAIALCTTFFPSRFTEAERKSGITNYIMGLSFITEGAIPFAAADPVRVLPACIIGAGTAGALSMFFECTLRAPHGGIFVVPTIGNPLLYLASIAIGSIVACFILALVKPSLKNSITK